MQKSSGARPVSKYVQISDDVRIRYRTAGNGTQVILLVPGWTMSCDVFERQFEHFEGSSTYTMISFDPRSQGLTTHTSEGNYYEQHGRDLHAFIEKLGLDNIVLGGWSAGVFDIMAYVHQFGSSKIKGLVVIDGSPIGTGVSKETEWVWYSRDDADGFRESLTQGPLLDRVKMNDEFARWMVEEPTPEYLVWVDEIMGQTSDGIAALLNESSAYQNYGEDLKKLEGQKSLLYFVRDEWGQVARNWAANSTPSATVIAFGKHMAFWEHADHFNEALDEFLKEI